MKSKVQGRGSTRHYNKWNKPIESKDTKRRMGYANIYPRRRDKTQNLTHWAPEITLAQDNNAGGTSLCLRCAGWIQDSMQPALETMCKTRASDDGVQRRSVTATSRPSTRPRGHLCPFPKRGLLISTTSSSSKCLFSVRACGAVLSQVFLPLSKGRVIPAWVYPKASTSPQ